MKLFAFARSFAEPIFLARVVGRDPKFRIPSPNSKIADRINE